MIDIPALFAARLREAHEAEGKLEVAGGLLWRASLLGNCMKMQTLQARGVPSRWPETDKSLARFANGHAHEDVFAGFMAPYVVHRELSVHDETLNLGAHIDFILEVEGERVGIELKSVQSKSFWYARKEKGTVAKEFHKIQAGACWLLAGRNAVRIDRYVVLSVSKDDLTMVQDEVGEEYIFTAAERAEELNDWWAKGDLPPCTCEPWYASAYCPYRGQENAGKGFQGKCCEIMEVV